MSIYFANRTIKHPREIIEDIFVKIDKFIFPIKFVILDMNEIVNVPLILAKLLVATSKEVSEVNDGKLALRVGYDEVIFRLPEAMKHPLEFDDVIYSFESPDLFITNCVQETVGKEYLENHLNQVDEDTKDMPIQVKEIAYQGTK